MILELGTLRCEGAFRLMYAEADPCECAYDEDVFVGEGRFFVLFFFLKWPFLVVCDGFSSMDEG